MRKSRRFLTLILSFIMIVTLFCGMSFAADSSDDSGDPAFTLTWSYGSSGQGQGGSGSGSYTVNFYYVDSDGNIIDGTNSTDVTKSGTSTTFTLSTYAGTIKGYSYQGAYLGSYDGTVASYLQLASSDSSYVLQYSEDNLTYSTWNVSSGTYNVYLVYEAIQQFR